MGANQDLEAVMNFKDIEVKFGAEDKNIVIDYTMMLSIYKQGDYYANAFTGLGLAQDKVSYRDEMRVQTALNVTADDDIVFITILEN